MKKLIESAKQEGIKSASWRIAKTLAGRFNPFRADMLSGIYEDDVTAVDWTIQRDFNSSSIPKPENGYSVAWLISPPEPTSGGHQNAFRFMKALEEAGHNLDIYFYAPQKFPRVNVAQIQEMLHTSSGYPSLKARLFLYDPEMGLPDGYDALFAVDWETAYPVYRHEGTAKRFYFAQDFEPAFYPWSSASVLAENTYKFGFHGITAGRWLAKKLTTEYGMTSDAYDFSVDTSRYSVINLEQRKEVVFYSRPPTARRATEFGLLVLKELNLKRPDVTINLVGWDMSGFDIPFPYVNHKAVDISELNAIYNRCAAGLVLSLTNMSLLPLELLAAGTVPVVNDASNTREVVSNENIAFVQLSPQQISQKIIEILDEGDHASRAIRISSDLTAHTWSDSAKQFTGSFEEAMLAKLVPDHSIWSD